MLSSVVNHSETSCQTLRDPLLSQELTPLQSALTKNAPITLLESALPKTLDLKSFRIRTYEKRRGEGCKLLTNPPALPVRLAATQPSTVNRPPTLNLACAVAIMVPALTRRTPR